MASFARIDENNIVINCVTVNDSDTQDADGNEVESIGAEFLNNLLGGVWKRYSSNTIGNKHYEIKEGDSAPTEGGTPFRKNGAGIGRIFDEARDAFYAPKPFNSWTLNEDTCQWDAPTARPDDDKYYNWNEDTQAWDLVDDGWDE